MKQWVSHTLLVLGGIVVGLLACEGSLRLVLPQPVYLMNRTYFFYHKYDNELGWTTRENVSGIDRPNPQEPAVHVSINGKGYRGTEYPDAKPRGISRIAILGDSITFGYGVEERDSYPAMTQHKLGAACQVINRGVTGYGLDQEYLLFKRSVLQQQPDMVVVGFSGGDIFDLTCSTRLGIPKPYFNLNDGQLTLHRPPAEFDKVNDRDIFFRGKPLQSFLFRHSHLFRLLFYRYSDKFKEDNVSIEEMSIFEGGKVASAIIREWKKICDDHGIKLLFLVIPQEDWLKQEGHGGGVSSRMAHAAAVQILEDLGLEYVDLWPVFSHQMDKGLFQKNDVVHPNRRGNEIIAEALARRILAGR